SPGGGYYDRYLEYYQGPAILVCPDRLLQPRVPVDLHDRRVRIVATETQIWRTGAAL
ncbi:MAG: 5-formyltetrahydrofolate cyclo-ligase, partial [Dysosmobacter welbionis]